MGWHGYTTVSMTTLSDLLWWHRNLYYNTGYSFRSRSPQGTLTTDACEPGWGAELVLGDLQFIAYGSYSTADGLTSSNQRETTAVLRSLLEFRPLLMRHQIRCLHVRTDNMVTMYNLRRQRASGGKLLEATRKIFSLLTETDIRLIMTHVPGVENGLADALSRMQSAGDYQLKAEHFQRGLRFLEASPTIDLFASEHNHKLPRYAALPGSGGSSATVWDAMTIPWTRETPYVFPPVQMIPTVLQKLRTDHVREAVMVVPEWPSRPWWNLLLISMTRRMDLGPSETVLAAGPTMTEENKLPPGSFIMVKLSFA